MFDKLVDLVVQFLDLFKPLRVVHAYQQAVLLRRGLFVRTLGPGWHLVIPLGVDEVICESVVTDTTRTGVQALTTADDVSVSVSVVVTWRVRSARKLLLQVVGKEQAMLDAATGVIARHVVGARWADLASEEFLDTITSEIAARAKKWGIVVDEVTWHDLVKAQTYRILGGPLSPSSPVS